MSRFSIPRAYRTARALLAEARYLRAARRPVVLGETPGADLLERVAEIRHEIAIERRRRARELPAVEVMP